MSSTNLGFMARFSSNEYMPVYVFELKREGSKMSPATSAGGERE